MSLKHVHSSLFRLAIVAHPFRCLCLHNTLAMYTVQQTTTGVVTAMNNHASSLLMPTARERGGGAPAAGAVAAGDAGGHGVLHDGRG